MPHAACRMPHTNSDVRILNFTRGFMYSADACVCRFPFASGVYSADANSRRNRQTAEAHGKRWESGKWYVWINLVVSAVKLCD